MPRTLQEEARQFRETLILISAGLTVSVNNCFRTPAENAAAGGDPLSQHLIALACDYNGDPEHLAVLGDRARLAGFVAQLRTSHLHVQRFPRDQNPLRVELLSGELGSAQVALPLPGRDTFACRC